MTLSRGPECLVEGVASALNRPNRVRLARAAERLAREPVPVTCDAERPLSDARRGVTGRAEGE